MQTIFCKRKENNGKNVFFFQTKDQRSSRRIDRSTSNFAASSSIPKRELRTLDRRRNDGSSERNDRSPTDPSLFHRSTLLFVFSPVSYRIRYCHRFVVQWFSKLASMIFLHWESRRVRPDMRFLPDKQLHTIEENIFEMIGKDRFSYTHRHMGAITMTDEGIFFFVPSQRWRTTDQRIVNS